MSTNELRYTFIFTPPENDADSWNLQLSTFAEYFQAAFPESDTWEEGALGPRPSQTLSFEAQIIPGSWLDGIVSIPFPATGSVVLYQATAAEAATVAAWLRDSYTPEAATIEYVTELAMENGIDDVGIVPQQGTIAEISQDLATYAENVDSRLQT